MKNRILKVGVLVFSLSSIGIGSIYLWKIKRSVDDLRGLPEVYSSGHTEKSSESSTKRSEGHGEVAKAGESSHGGAPKAEDGHGGSDEGRAPASVVSKGVLLFSVDELYVNVNSDKGAHVMGLKLELELFDEEKRDLVKSRHSGIRDRIIEISRGFDYAKLNTLGGKLYFKETIVGTLNEFFGQAIIKNAHISSLYLQ